MYLHPAKKLVVAMLMACGPLPLWAQDSDLVSTTVGTCNLSGSVKVTALGVVTTTPLPCVNPTGVNAQGADHDEIVGTMAIGVPALANVASVSAPEGFSALGGVAVGSTALAGFERLDYESVMQGQVLTEGLAGGLVCESSAGTLTCGAGTGIASLEVAGQPVVLPSAPIPLDYTLPLANLSLAVNVLGIGVLNIPVSGNIVFNKVVVTGIPTQRHVAHSLLEIHLTGSVTLFGLGVISVDAKIVDSSQIALVGTREIAVSAAPITAQQACEVTLDLIELVDLGNTVSGQPCPP